MVRVPAGHPGKEKIGSRPAPGGLLGESVGEICHLAIRRRHDVPVRAPTVVCGGHRECRNDDRSKQNEGGTQSRVLARIRTWSQEPDHLCCMCPQAAENRPRISYQSTALNRLFRRTRVISPAAAAAAGSHRIPRHRESRLPSRHESRRAGAKAAGACTAETAESGAATRGECPERKPRKRAAEGRRDAGARANPPKPAASEPAGVIECDRSVLVESQIVRSVRPMIEIDAVTAPIRPPVIPAPAVIAEQPDSDPEPEIDARLVEVQPRIGTQSG